MTDNRSCRRAPDPDHPGWYSWGDFRAGQLRRRRPGSSVPRRRRGQARVRMFPTTQHLNMGGSIHGGAVMSFIDMALFAGGRCAGMGEGHYVTLDCATHFIARGQIGVPLDAVVRLVGADQRRACLPVGPLRAGRAQPTPQLHRHAQAHPPKTRRRMTGPVGTAYAALVAAGELKPDPDQATAVAALDRFAAEPRQGEAAACCRACSARPTRPRGVYLWGGVGRGKSMLMDLAYRQHRRRPQAPHPLRAVHARRPPAAARRARDRGRRPGHRRSPKQLADEVKFLAFDEMMVTNSADAMIMSRLFTALIERGGGDRHHLEPPAVATSTRTASTASCSCPSSR